MEYALVGVIGILACLFAIGMEFIILYKMAQKDDNTENEYEAMRKKISIRIEGIVYAPTKSAAEREILELTELINDDAEKYELVENLLAEYREKRIEDKEAVEKIDSLHRKIDETVKPAEIYSKMLAKGDSFHKCHACRRLADLDAREKIDDVRELVGNKDRNLAYNAAMALAKFGDSEKVAEYIISIQDDKAYSGRIINELVAGFGGDRVELATLIFENDKCSDYMKRTLIKALADYKLEEFHAMYLDGAINGNEEYKVACIKALAEFGNPEDEHILQVSVQSSNWVVRASAIRGLALIDNKTSLATVKNALSDKEWWVRQTAAKCIITMSISTSDLEEILGGYDRFAADAVKQVLYKHLHETEE